MGTRLHTITTIDSFTLQAFSTFSYTANYFAPNITTVKKEVDSWKDILTAVNNNCSRARNSSTVTDECIKNGKAKRFCYQHCFNGLFMLHLLESGYGFKSNATNQWSVEFQDKVRERGIRHGC
jgi:hypothetical protein